MNHVLAINEKLKPTD